MRRRRTLIVLLLAILSGTVAAVSAFRYLQDRPTPLIANTTTVETRPVVIAARPIPLGTSVTEQDLEVIDWPAAALPQGIHTSVSEVVGRSVITNIALNEPVLATKLADTGIEGLLTQIPPGLRALTVNTDQVRGVAGYVTPGNRVDIILIRTPMGGNETVSKIIMENILVLTANQQYTETEDGQPIISQVVTFLLTPAQAEKLALAESEGAIRMVLRNILDQEQVTTLGERESRLFDREGASTPAPSRPRVGVTSRPPQENIIEMFRGGQRTLLRYR
ncbi:MAG TPA: Flp pilus assembly protein CpaB [Longimicrobiales bacterium]|nr:Flp pilus assembly protein CpaB [Longimicrobiales bacterium]